MFDSWICGKCGRRWKFSEPVSFERLYNATAKLKNSGRCSPECAAIRPPKQPEYVYFPPEKWTYPVLAVMPERKKPAAAADGGGDVRDVGGFIRAFGRSRFLARDAFSFELVLSEVLAL